MDSTQARTELVRSGYLNSNVMSTGLTLLAVGGVLGVLGLGISGTAMMRSFRRWLTAQQQQQQVRAIASPAKTTPAKTTPTKTTPTKTASAVSSSPKEMATPSAAR
jgi:pyruvate/2-oxoglutarate dehydrogenase complex dihydrolipoamide acyltransferase (E2) component